LEIHPIHVIWVALLDKDSSDPSDQGCIKIAFLESNWREIIIEYPVSDSSVMKPVSVLVFSFSANACLIRFGL
jgi:hypothetical protein